MASGKKIVLLSLCIAVMLCVHASALAEFGVAYRSDSVNMRQQPSKNSTKLASYKAGTWMNIQGESGNWYYVISPDGRSGYISKNYISVAQEMCAGIRFVSNPKKTSFLNLRASPSYQAQVLGIYYNGTPCVVCQYYGNGWIQVTIEGTMGYLRQEFLSSEVYMPWSDQCATVITPNGSGLNLRTGPGMGYQSIRLYSGGTYVMVLQKGEQWWQVAVDGKTGFMNADYLYDGLLPPSRISQMQQSGSSGGGSGTFSSDGYATVSNPLSTQVLNLREAPTTTSRAVGQFINGTLVKVLDQGTEWCRVQVVKTGAVGYMMTRYLTLQNLPSTPYLRVNHPQRSYVNLRAFASTDSRVLMQMQHGLRVTVLVPGTTWTKVSCNGVTGYVMTIFLIQQ